MIRKNSPVLVIFYFLIHPSNKGKVEYETIVKEMLKECPGPMNFTTFISKFAEKIGSADQEQVLLNAFLMFDLDDTGVMIYFKICINY